MSLQASFWPQRQQGENWLLSPSLGAGPTTTIVPSTPTMQASFGPVRKYAVGGLVNSFGRGPQASFGGGPRGSFGRNTAFAPKAQQAPSKYRPMGDEVIFLDEDYLTGLGDTDREMLLYGAIDNAMVAPTAALGQVKDAYEKDYDSYLAQRSLWDEKPGEADKGYQQWLTKWNTLVPQTVTPGFEGGDNYAVTPFAPNKNWDSPEFDYQKVGLNDMYKNFTSKQTGKDEEGNPIMASVPLWGSDHESGDIGWGKYNSQITRAILDKLYPGMDDALDQSASKAFIANANKAHDDYSTYSVYHGADQIAAGIADQMSQLGHQYYNKDQIKEVLSSINPKYAQQRMQAIKSHKVEDNADDGGDLGPLSAIASIASMIPGPWQPFAMAANAAINVANKNPLGAIMSGLGAIGGFGGLDAFSAADAAQLAQQGLSTSQISDILGQSYNLNPAIANMGAMQGQWSSMLPGVGGDALKGALMGALGGGKQGALLGAMTGGVGGGLGNMGLDPALSKFIAPLVSNYMVKGRVSPYTLANAGVKYAMSPTYK